MLSIGEQYGNDHRIIKISDRNPSKGKGAIGDKGRAKGSGSSI